MFNSAKLEGTKLEMAKTEIFVTFVDGCALGLDAFDGIVSRLWGQGNGEPYVYETRQTGRVTYKLESRLQHPSVALLDEHLEDFVKKMYQHFFDCRVFMVLDTAFYAEDGRVFVNSAQRDNFITK